MHQVVLRRLIVHGLQMQFCACAAALSGISGTSVAQSQPLVMPLTSFEISVQKKNVRRKTYIGAFFAHVKLIAKYLFIFCVGQIPVTMSLFFSCNQKALDYSLQIMLLEFLRGEVPMRNLLHLSTTTSLDGRGYSLRWNRIGLCPSGEQRIFVSASDI